MLSMRIDLRVSFAPDADDEMVSACHAASGGNPANNKDGGDWMAFMALAAGNICK